jgi:hypothetical protein
MSRYCIISIKAGNKRAAQMPEPTSAIVTPFLTENS